MSRKGRGAELVYRIREDWKVSLRLLLLQLFRIFMQNNEVMKKTNTYHTSLS